MLDDPHFLLAHPNRKPFVPDPACADGDPLSDILALLQVRSGQSLRIAAGGAWALRFPEYDYLKFIAQVQGCQWISVDGSANAIRLDVGDCLVMHGGLPFVVASDLSVPVRDGVEHFTRHADPATGAVQWGGAEEVVAVAGRFDIDPAQRELLAALLPPVLHIRSASVAAPALRMLLDMYRRQDGAAPGQRLVRDGLARIALVEALRAQGAVGTSGWLGAIADPKIGAVLRRLHAEPWRHWSLPDLARIANMSRSALALRFKTLVGIAPLQYLQRWRMQLSCHALRHGDEPVATLAYRLGYASESAFSAAFKRHTGSAPGQFRRSFRHASS
jgi:AraC-like DNA-binding protein